MKRLAFLLLLLAPATASAFPTGDQFDLDPLKEDGAGGIAFTGLTLYSTHIKTAPKRVLKAVA